MIDGLDQPIDDLDEEPMTFTLDAVVPDLGTRRISFACDDGAVTALDLFVYRQTGTTRGAMGALVLLATIGLVAAAAIAAVSGAIPAASTTSDDRPPWLPS